MEYVTLDKYLTKLTVTLLPGELYINQLKMLLGKIFLVIFVTGSKGKNQREYNSSHV